MTENSIQPSGPVPLLIGVVGHRDLPADETSSAAFREGIRTILSSYAKAFPHTQVRLMSLLAEGADALGVEAAKEAGIPVIGVLPMPRVSYEIDFEGEEKVRFLRRLSDCAEVYEIPVQGGATLESIAGPGPDRDRQYAAGGAFLAGRCQALVALWNGRDNARLGGTAHVVRMQLEGDLRDPDGRMQSGRQADALDTPTSGPVHWIYGFRIRKVESSERPDRPDIDCVLERGCSIVDLAQVGGSGETGMPGYSGTLYPAGWRTGTAGSEEPESAAAAKAAGFYRGLCSSVDRFNRDSLGIPDSVPAYPIRQSGDPVELESVSRLFESADRASPIFKKRADRILSAVAGTGFACFSSMVIFDELLNFVPVLFGFFGLFAVTAAIYRLGVRREYDSRFFDYRNLAELCRVTYFLGLRRIEFDPGRLIPGKLRASLAWIAYAVRAVTVPMALSPRPALQASRPLEGWVRDQISYYLKAVRRKDRFLGKARRFRMGFFLLALAAALGFFVAKAVTSRLGIDPSPWWDLRAFKSGQGPNWTQTSSWLQALFDIFISIGAAAAFLIEKKAYEQEVELYDRALRVFRNAERILAEPGLPARDFDAVLLSLGTLAVEEHSEWNAIHRAQPLELPLG